MFVICKTISGSRLYGTNIATSDLDIRGVYLPTVSNCVLGTVQDVISREGDTQYYSLQKFLRLATEGQSVAIEMLFATKDNLPVSSPLWERILARRSEFVTKKMAAFIGYARTMSTKYSSRADRLADVRHLMSLTHGYPETTRLAEIFDSLPAMANAKKDVTTTSRAADKRVYNVCGREYSVYLTLVQFRQHLANIEADYGSRVRKAQENTLDFKALMHAFRVAYQCKTMIETGGLEFPLPEAAYLTKMRTGQIDFKENHLDEKLTDLVDEVEQLLLVSNLPESCNPNVERELILEAYSL